MNLSRNFTPGYIDNIFLLWYTSGKPSATKFQPMIPIDPLTGTRPAPTTIRKWMDHDEWIEREQFQDAEIEKVMRDTRIAATVEMLERHAEQGREMQNIAIGWIRDNKDDLGPGSAVRLLVDGVAMEQATASIPDMLIKMKEMDNEKLLDEIARSITETPSEDADRSND